MTFRVTLPDDPDLPIKEEDKHQTEKILEAPTTIRPLGGGPNSDDPNTYESPDAVIEPYENAEFIVTAPEDFITQNDMETIFRSAIPNLIQFVEELNLPEKTKIIGKLRGALELFNTK